MVGAQDAGAVFEVLLVQGDGLVEPACVVVGVGEVVACGQGVGVVGAQDAGAVFEVLLVQGDGLVEPARCLVGAGEVVACGQGAGMVWTQGVAHPRNRISKGNRQMWHPKVGRIPQSRCE